MPGLEILLYPETGPDFLRALKMAILYAERVHVLTLLEKDLLTSFQEQAGRLTKLAGLGRRRYRLENLKLPIAVGAFGVSHIDQTNDGIVNYLEFVDRHHSDLAMLSSEGVLVSAFPKGFGVGGTFRPDSQVLRAFERWPPAYVDFLLKHGFPDELMVGTFQLYLCIMAGIAQRNGLGLSTWFLDFNQAFWTSVWQLADGGPISMAPIFEPGQAAQQSVRETQLAYTALERSLPRVDDLPFDEILKFRGNHRSELDAFRTGIGKLATGVDLTKAPADLELQLKDVVSRDIDPALHELQAELSQARRGILKNIVSERSLALGLMSVAVSLLSGVPPDISAIIGLGSTAVSVAGAALVQSKIEQRNHLTKSPWSIIFRLRQLQEIKLKEARRRGDPFGGTP